jgi:hypothetical protein
VPIAAAPQAPDFALRASGADELDESIRMPGPRSDNRAAVIAAIVVVVLIVVAVLLFAGAPPDRPPLQSG